MSVEVFVSGFLFLLLIVIALVASLRFGSEAWSVSDLDADAKLQEINENPERFKIGVVLALVEHVGIVSLAAPSPVRVNAHTTPRMILSGPNATNNTA